MTKCNVFAKQAKMLKALAYESRKRSRRCSKKLEAINWLTNVLVW
jgi:hypothetical protein